MRAGLLFVLLLGSGCAGRQLGQRLERRGEEIMVCGELIHVGAPVVLWTDPGGYDAYRVERRFVPLAESDWAHTRDSGMEEPNRYGLRRVNLTDAEREHVRGGGWDRALLARHVDQVVVHYDAAGTARTCFRVLHDMRGLSCHFLLDLDGTIYQTLDVKERAWHATIANDRSIGIEIAHIGAYPPGPSPLDRWYQHAAGEPTRLTLPPALGDGGIRRPELARSPARPELITGTIQGQQLVMYDFTEAQYRSLARLLATLATTLPRLPLDYPRAPDGTPRTTVLTPEEFREFRGILGHYHVQENKIDPGPAFDWERVLSEARRLAR